MLHEICVLIKYCELLRSIFFLEVIVRLSSVPSMLTQREIFIQDSKRLCFLLQAEETDDNDDGESVDSLLQIWHCFDCGSAILFYTHAD